MPWTALFFLVGAAAISGLPLLNGFVSEWLLFQALLSGFQAVRRPRRLALPGGGRAAGADERAGGGVLREGVRDHVPGAAAGRGGGEGARVAGADARAAGRSWRSLCVVLGLAPGLGARGAAGRRGARCRGCVPAPEMVRGLVRDRARARTASTTWRRLSWRWRCWSGWRWRGRCSLGARLRGEARADVGLRRRAVGADGVHGHGVLEAPDDDLRRDLPADAGGVEGRGRPRTSRSEVKYRAEIEPTFERFVYGPLTRGVLGAGRADEGDPGRQPPRLPRLRAGPGHRPAALAWRWAVSLQVLGLAVLAGRRPPGARPAAARARSRR